MPKWNTINDFEIPSDSYISQFTSPKDLLIDLMGENFYKYEMDILNNHCDEETVEEMKSMETYYRWDTWTFLESHFRAFLNHK